MFNDAISLPRYVLAWVFSATSIVCAQQQEIASTEQEVAGLVQGIAPANRDLNGKVITLAGYISNLKSEVQDIGGKDKGVDAQVIDLKVKESKTEIRFELSGDVLFDFDKAEILPRAEPALKKIVDTVKEHKGARIIVDGHTDGKGNDSYNQTLSQRRAEAVKRWLADNSGRSILPQTITTHGYGKLHPVAPNTNPDGTDNPENRQKNRRVEITVKK